MKNNGSTPLSQMLMRIGSTTGSQVLMLIAVLAVLTVPWLGETYFNSKGEPREAIVAVSMLESGNWILPTSYGGDIPYKPPFLAWIIAVFSLLFNGGTVNEFCSRLPSALAFIAIVAGFFMWLRPRVRQLTAGVAAGVLATSFEVFRSAVICRVDMLLTACIVLALLLMYSWRELRRWWKIPLIVLLLSGAVLTKGPVGALLPCLAMGIFCLLRRDNFFVTVGWLAGVCLASMILPALWYLAAYQQGGDNFLALAYEENIGRLTGTMGYDSHLNPWYYNLLTLLWGMLPWTLTVLIGVFLVKWRLSLGAFQEMWNRQLGAYQVMWQRLRSSSLGLFSVTVALTVLIFYCIPASKRSVYLLPMYPFLALGVARLLIAVRETRALSIYNKVWLWVGLLAMAACVAAPWLPLGKLRIDHPGALQWVLMPVAPSVVVYLLCRRIEPIKSLLASTLALFFFYLAVVQPLVLNPKSDRRAAPQVQALLDADVPVYSLIEDSLMRYYTLNFYTSDRLRRLEREDSLPAGRPVTVLVQEQCLPSISRYTSEPYDTTLLIPRSCDNRRAVILCTFKTK